MVSINNKFAVAEAEVTSPSKPRRNSDSPLNDPGIPLLGAGRRSAGDDSLSLSRGGADNGAAKTFSENGKETSEVTPPEASRSRGNLSGGVESRHAQKKPVGAEIGSVASSQLAGAASTGRSEGSVSPAQKLTAPKHGLRPLMLHPGSMKRAKASGFIPYLPNIKAPLPENKITPRWRERRDRLSRIEAGQVDDFNLSAEQSSVQTLLDLTNAACRRFWRKRNRPEPVGACDWDWNWIDRVNAGAI